MNMFLFFKLKNRNAMPDGSEGGVTEQSEISLPKIAMSPALERRKREEEECRKYGIEKDRFFKLSDL